MLAQRITIILSTKPSLPLECDIGYYSISDTGREPCVRCEMGSTTEYSGSSYCTCSAGYFGREGRAPCYRCAEGHRSGMGESYCTPCVGFAPCVTDNFNISSYVAQVKSMNGSYWDAFVRYLQPVVGGGEGGGSSPNKAPSSPSARPSTLAGGSYESLFQMLKPKS